ncbi:hypothetical protein MPDQ_006518 [Monascus purpureus]|uniref:U1-type domain-containing protein n=1 Tax=Monascus purpureus TaxID=5098 RepID=A0A507QWF8_MONPU|nr:hypothetical protein MPDQ_006518 [Monascus purpureus]BDD58431.1 hypothetical protein MAP00_003711 [Monascus purpureus]
MAEYWKSAPRFWCKQCKVFIRDTPFEKSQHEASGKHQGNLKRFLRDLHRDNERQQRESQKAKNEVERLRQTIAGGPSTGPADNGIPPWKRTTPKPQERPVSLEERKKQMAQLAEMGIAIPDEFRGEMALAGEWKTVSEKVIQEKKKEPSSSSTPAAVGVRKRKHEGGDEDSEGEDPAPTRFVSRGWGSALKQYPGSKEDEDLDALLESTKEIKRVKPSVSDTPDAKNSDTPVKDEGQATVQETDEVPHVKKEEPTDAAMTLTTAAETERKEAVPEVIFKKRRPKAMRK